MGLPVLSAAPVTLRHVKRATGAGATTVLGATLVAQPPRGINGRRGYQSGSFEPALGEEGTATIRLANTAGEDGVLHRRRFLILTDPGYRIGDEWIEVRQQGRVLFVGTPADYEKTPASVTLQLVDAVGTLVLQRETAAGFWTHAPRDAFEHYTRAWVPIVADDFPDGADPAKWTTVNGTNQAGSVRLTPPAADTTAALEPTAATPGVITGVQRSWRLEMTHNRSLAPGGSVVLMLYSGDVSAPRFEFRLSDTTTDLQYFLAPGGGDFETISTVEPARKDGGSLAIEARDRWVLFYVDGQLRMSLEHDFASATHVYKPYVQARNGATSGTTVDVLTLLLRRADPYLMRGTDRGDLRLPGVLPAGGLQGSYYDEAGLRALGDTTRRYYRRVLAPTRQPYARRQDPAVNFPQATPPTWMPAGPPNGEYFTARWTGAIYLDLEDAEITLRLSQLDNAARLWVGKTMYGDQLLDQWLPPTGAPFTITTSGLRGVLGSQSGWYPIRIDFAQGAGAGGIVLEWSVGGGAYEVVPPAVLSPLGIYDTQVRYDSHIEQLKALTTAYGLQFRCEPRPLESGVFPAEVVPRVRVGRDTDRVLDASESTDVSVRGSATETISTLLADAAGLGDQANAAQLTAETIDYASVLPADPAGRHMMIHTAYESLADITDPALLQTRLASMLGLRLTAWEEITARPRGHRERRDTFPLTGQLAEFHWEPGDGLRVRHAAVDLDDDTPRQIIAPSWPFNPDGLGSPSVRFRQRPRSQQDALRALIRAVLTARRNYQGQLVTTNGTWSDTDGGYSRAALPADLSDVIRCELIVGFKSDTSIWAIRDHPAGTQIATFQTTGRINLLPYLKARSDSFGGVSQQLIVRVLGGTGTAQCALELLIRS